jgi:two-component system, LytTR family, response regulator
MRAIIIDDEPNAVGLLELRLAQHCPQIEIVAACTNSIKGVEAIKYHQPDLLFLDIEMPQMNGFQVLEAIGDIAFSLIFVTAYDKFAVKAFKYSALDYILKPIETEELIAAVTKVEKHRQTNLEQINHLKKQLSGEAKALPNQIALPYQNGVKFVSIDNILFAESDNNYTKFYLNDDKTYMVTRSLKEMQELLEDRGFLRIHRQYLVNVAQVAKFVKGDTSHVILTNSVQIPVSRNHRDQLIERFEWI